MFKEPGFLPCGNNCLDFVGQILCLVFLSPKILFLNLASVVWIFVLNRVPISAIIWGRYFPDSIC